MKRWCAVCDFFGREIEEQWQVGHRSFGELLFIEREQMREIAPRWAGLRQRVRRNMLQAKFGDGFR